MAGAAVWVGVLVLAAVVGWFAAVLGIGRTLAYDLVRTDRWPTPVLRVGKLIRIPTAALRRLLDPDTAAAPDRMPDHC